MDIQTGKINFVQEFLRLKNIKLIEKLEKILLEDKAKEYEANLKPMSMDNFDKKAPKTSELFLYRGRDLRLTDCVSSRTGNAGKRTVD